MTDNDERQAPKYVLEEYIELTIDLLFGGKKSLIKDSAGAWHDAANTPNKTRAEANTQKESISPEIKVVLLQSTHPMPRRVTRFTLSATVPIGKPKAIYGKRTASPDRVG